MTNTITAIQPSSEDPNMRDIYVDDALIASLPTSAISQFQIELGQPWSEESARNYATHTANNEARSIALKLLARRAWGINELTTRLIKRGVEHETAAKATSQLAEDGWLDDHVYASALIRQWTRKEPAGRRWLEHKLREKEIPTDTVCHVINAILEHQSEQDAATKLASMRLAKVKNLERETARRRVIAALGRRGFNTGVASEAIRLAQLQGA